MKKNNVKTILLKYFNKDEYGNYRPIYIADCDMWNEMFIELFRKVK